ncbi:hypothetical protein [Mucilaginibacter terrae]|uniref:Quinol oxidase subunit 4 n=1 Tax=Mucilaginibacter terrae TaxID=1955052 RepID=A0ABU3GX56_9SPHI|nr:hypothetical protein [Mucilaginibacter terrae]MDT3404343.1 hypothetical protein [Mucilaginibacter terrae]
MKKIILSIALLASVVVSLSSCMVEQRRGRNYDRYHRHYDRYHGPYDNNGYRRH